MNEKLKLNERTENVEKIGPEDLEPIVPESGGGIIVLQRNEKDDRSPDSEDFGALTKNGAEKAREISENFFNKIFKGLSEEDKKSVDIMVVASGANLVLMPGGLKSTHKRAVETAEEVLNGIESVADNFGLSKDQILNTFSGGKPIELPEIKDLLALEDSPDFIKFLIDKYGTGKGFWVNYEIDSEKETRTKMGAEGPEEIAERMQGFLDTIQKSIIRSYRKKNPDRRLVVWAVSHYDSISPWAKKATGFTPFDEYFPVEHGAGVVIEQKKDGQMAVMIGKRKFDISAEPK